MKKINFLILILMALFINLPLINAEDTSDGNMGDTTDTTIGDENDPTNDTGDPALTSSIKLSDIANKMQENMNLDGTGNEATITSDDDSIDVNNGEYQIIFNYKNGLLSYKFNENVLNSDDVVQLLNDNGIFLELLICSVGELKGYDKDVMKKWIKTVDTKSLTLEKDGIVYSYNTYEDNDGAATTTLTVIDTMQLDIDKFNIDTSIVNEVLDAGDEIVNDVLENTEANANDIENPKTGYALPIIVSVVSLVAGIVLTVYYQNKLSFNKF